MALDTEQKLISLGSAGMKLRWRGAWYSGGAFQNGDVVSHSDALFVYEGARDLNSTSAPPASPWASLASGASLDTDLSIANRGATTLDLLSSTGLDVTIPAVTTSLCGLMTAADKVALDAGGATNLSLSNRTSTTQDVLSSTGTDVTLPAAHAVDGAGLLSAPDKALLNALGGYAESVVSGVGSTVTISQASPAKVGWTGHGLAADQPVVLSTTGGLPAPLAVNTTYYVRNPAANDFEVSATPGGASINTTTAGSGTHSAINAVKVGSGGAVDVASIVLPTAGDWDVDGMIHFFGPAGTLVKYIISSVSLVSITLDSTPGNRNDFVFDLTSGTAIFGVGNRPALPFKTKRLSVGSATTVYMVGLSEFTTSTMVAYGALSRRLWRP